MPPPLTKDSAPMGGLGLVAVLLLTDQVASKAARDALFLVAYDPRSLPAVMVAGAFVSIAAVLGARMAHARMRPEMVLSSTLVLSAVLFGVETALVAPHPHAIAVMLYLHVSALGALLVSSFWTVVSARCDPHVGRERVARLAALAALGGILGGVAAQLSPYVGGAPTLLPILAVSSLALAALVYRTATPARVAAHAPARPVEPKGAPPGYLWGLAALAALVAVWEALLDFAFKAAVDEALDDGALVRFFGVYYMATSVAAFLVQTLLGRLALRRAGVAATAAVTPLAVTAGVVALAFTSLPVFVALRGAAAVFSSSFLRSAYEVYFTPVPTEVLRKRKALVDVAATRAGDVVGSLLVFVLVALGAGLGVPLVVAAALGAVGLVLLPFVTRGYVASLTALLRAGGRPDGDPDQLDRTTRLVLRGAADVPAAEPSGEAATEVVRTALASRVAALESADASVALRALEPPLEPSLARIALSLLSRAELRPAATAALRRVAPQATGALLDALLDPSTPPAVRVRIPTVLRAASVERAVPALLAGLDDAHLDVRLECARGLVHVVAGAQDVELDTARVLRAVQREIAEHGEAWAQGSHDLEDVDDERSPLEAILRKETARSLRCAIVLTSLTIDAKQLELALRGLQAPEPSVSGTAFELLLTILPEKVREPLARGLDPDRRPAEALLARTA